MAGFGKVLVLVAGIAMLTASPAAANPVTARQLDRGSMIIEPEAFVSPVGEQMVSYKKIDAGNNQALGVRVGRNGHFGLFDELSRTANSESPAIAFNRRGRAYAIWGIATNGATAEQSERAAGGIFEATRNTVGCTRYVATTVGPGGVIAVACSHEQSSNPPDFWAISFRDGLGVTGLALSPSVFDSHIEPQAIWGKDGTFAAAAGHSNAIVDPPPPFSSSSIKVYVQNQGEGWSDSLDLPSVTEPDYQDLSDTDVTSDGRVVLSTGANPGGAQLQIRSPGELGTFSTVNLAGNSAMKSEADRSGRLHVLTGEYSMSDPFIFRVYQEQPGGTFGPHVRIPMPDNSCYVPRKKGFSVAPDGTEFAVISGNHGTYVSVRRRGRGSFSQPVKIGPPSNSNPSGIPLAGDNLLVAWDREIAVGDQRLMVGGWDSGKPPKVSRLRVPKSALVRTGTGFSVKASDPMGVRTVKWKFGDGQRKSGASVTHSYRRPGRYRVKATAIDNAGNRKAVTRRIKVLTPR